MGKRKNTDKLAKKPGIVIDTCVLLRAMYCSVYPEKYTRENAISFNALAMARRDHAICFTKETRSEAIHMIAVIKRGFMDGLPREAERLRFVEKFIEPYALMVQPAPSALRCRDINDQMILEAAVGAQARYIISTDKDLLMLKQDGACSIVLPEQFNREANQRLRAVQDVAAKRAFALTS